MSVHAKANSVFKREAIVRDTMSLMAAVYARGHKRQGSPASYVTLNTSTSQGGASEITSRVRRV